MAALGPLPRRPPPRRRFNGFPILNVERTSREHLICGGKERAPVACKADLYNRFICDAVLLAFRLIDWLIHFVVDSCVH